MRNPNLRENTADNKVRRLESKNVARREATAHQPNRKSTTQAFESEEDEINEMMNEIQNEHAEFDKTLDH